MAKTSKSLLLSVMAVVIAAVVIIGFMPEPSFAADETTPTGVTSVSISLGETIAVKLHTTAIKDDGSKVVVVYSGEETTLEKNVNGVFSFSGVTPQNFADELTATMYAKDGTKVGESVTFSIRSYLEALLELSYENSGCASSLQYVAMKELAVNMLNYGAAAQVYVNHDVENLANKNLTDEQKALATKPITVSESDKAINGDAWVGAGVRFDYRLGLYFVFEAESLDGVIASVNGKKATPVVYDASKNWYVIRYSDFSATNMNDVVTARLSIGDSMQTYSYSIKSYVAAKGGNDSALAKLVNATYAYGYAAVAYTGDFAVVEPTFESVGYIGIDSKGYDFTGSVYAPAKLPVLNENDYTISTTISSISNKPLVYTVYTYNNGSVSYSKNVETKDALRVNDELYTSNDISRLNSDEVEVTYDEATGYTYHAKTAQSLTFIASYGNALTITGDVTVVRDTNNWSHYNTLNIGTASVAGNLTVNPATCNNWALRLESGADMNIAEGSTMTVTQGACTYSVFSAEQGSTITVDGTLTTASKIRLEKAAKIDANYEYGFQPALYVRKGTVTIENGQLMTNSVQVGSEKYGYKGTLNITQTAKGTNSSSGSGGAIQNTINFENYNGALRYAFGNGYVNLTDASTAGLTGMDVRNKASCYLTFGSGITVKTSSEYVYIVGSWSAGTDYRWSISTDAKFISSMGTLMTQSYNGGSTHISYNTPVTLTIDGKTVKALIAEYTTTTSTATVPASKFVDNGDGTKSVADLTFTAGNYVSVADSDVVLDTAGAYTKATYTDGAGTVHTIYYKIVSEHTHRPTLVEGKKPTCTETGIADSYLCECGRLFEDATAENEITAPAVLPIKEHTEVVDAAVAPTCTEDGLTQGKHCSSCGVVFVAQEAQAALGHVDENGDNKCDREGCGITMCEKHVEVIDAGKAATCTEDGLTEGKHCSACGQILVAQTVLTSPGHAEVIDAGVKATCTTSGLTEGKHCSVCSEVLVAQTVVEALNHKNAEHVAQIDATFETEGFTGYYACPDCGKKFADKDCLIETTPSATPKLSLTDYTTNSTRSADTNPTVTTTFTLISDEITYSVALTSKDILYVNRGSGDIGVSKYDYYKLNTDIATITYEEGKGYTYSVKEGETETGFAGLGIRAYGAMLTITGNLEITLSSRWGHNYGLTIGTAEKPATVTVKATGTGDTTKYGLALWNGSDLIVNKGSTLNITNSSDYTIYTNAVGSTVTVDGTVTVNRGIYIAGGAVKNAAYEYGFVPGLYVREGTVNITGQLWTNSLQVGSENEKASGTLNLYVSGDKNNADRANDDALLMYTFAKGTVKLDNSHTKKCGFDVGSKTASAEAYIELKGGMTIETTKQYGSFVGDWGGSKYTLYVDLGFTFNGTVNNFFAMKNGTKNYYFYRTQTVNIDGENKEVVVATHQELGDGVGYFTIATLNGLNVAANGAYVSTTETKSFGNRGTFTAATYTDGENTSTIYYQVNE